MNNISEILREIAREIRNSKQHPGAHPGSIWQDGYAAAIDDVARHLDAQADSIAAALGTSPPEAR